MSLKAYDGLMTKRGFKYLQDETIKRIDKFKEIAETHLAKSMAEDIIGHVDNNFNLTDKMLFSARCKESEKLLKELNEEVKIKKTTILSYIYQSSRILSKSFFMNDYTIDLKLTIEEINNKILVYPNLTVQKYKEVLLEYLEDWYAQDQCDGDENVDTEEWEERCKDWHSFDENKYFKTQIKIFDSNDFLNNLNFNFRGGYLVDKILEFIPSDRDRLIKIAKDEIVNNELRKLPKKEGESKVLIWV
jgi:hypothetical protein